MDSTFLLLLGVALFHAIPSFLYGYETTIISSALQFIIKDFGLENDSFKQGLAVSEILIGCLIGSLISGKLADLFGRVRMLVVADIFAIGFTLATALAPNYATFVVLRTLLGVSIGVYSVVVPLFVAETAQKTNRGTIGVVTQLMITVGILFAYVFGAIATNFKHNWHIMISIGILFNITHIIGSFALRIESPKWLVKVNRITDAEKVLIWLRKTKHIEEELNELIFETTGNATINENEAENENSTLSQPQRHRTTRGKVVTVFIGIFLNCFNQFSGINAILYYCTDFFVRAGLSSEAADYVPIMIGVINVLLTILSSSLLDKLGRRTLLLSSGAGMAVCHAILAAAFYGMEKSDAKWISVICIIFSIAFVCSFAVGLGPIPWIVVGEVFPVHTRGRIMGFALAGNWSTNLVVSTLFPILIQHFGSPLVFIGFSILCLIGFCVVFALLPETKGKTVEENISAVETFNPFSCTRKRAEKDERKRYTMEFLEFTDTYCTPKTISFSVKYKDGDQFISRDCTIEKGLYLFDSLKKLSVQMGLPRHLEIPFLSTVELFVEKEIEKAERDSFDETILSEEKQNALIEQWEVNNEEIRKEEGNRTNSHQKESENEFSDKIKNEELKQQNDLDEEEINILAEKINSLLPEKTNQFRQAFAEIFAAEAKYYGAIEQHEISSSVDLTGLSLIHQRQLSRGRDESLIETQLCEVTQREQYWMYQKLKLMEEQKREFRELVLKILFEIRKGKYSNDECNENLSPLSLCIGSQSCTEDNTEMFFLKLGKVQQVVYQCLLITAPILSFFANTMECFKQATIYENRELLLTEKMKKVKKIEEIDQTALTKEAIALTKKYFGSSQESPYFSLPDKNSTLYELAIASRLALFQQNELSAIIIPTLPHPTHDSLQSAFMSACSLSTDVHFPPIAAQLRRSRAVHTGDVFVTKHSNLIGVHIAFHLCCRKEERNESPIFMPRGLLQGIANIIGICCQYGVSVLTIPIPLLSESAVALDDAIIAKQCTLVLGVLRRVLAVRPSPSLHTLRFAFPVHTDWALIRQMKADALFLTE